MADYRELSQEYAQGAIKAAILLNGGAAVALLSQIGAVIEHSLVSAIRIPMILWAIGTALGGFAWLFGFLSTRYVDKSERESRKENILVRTSNAYMGLGVASISVSFLLFLSGCICISLQLTK